MKPILPLLLWPAMLLALDTRPIPSPVDYLGESIPLLDGTILSDSTWVVSDSERTLWYSRDHGTDWEPLPVDDQGLDGALFDGAVVSDDRLSTWAFASGWTPMHLPASFVSADESFFGTRGDRSFRDEEAGKIRFYRSTDGMKTWTDWFSMDTSCIPEGSTFSGEREVGRIWYLVADSGYARGTGNGTNWTKAVLPKGFDPLLFDPDDADTALQLLGHDSTGLVIARSRDLGTTWKILPMTVPGNFCLKLAPGLWSSSTSTDIESPGDLWFARTPTGPWSEVEATGVNGFFAWGATPVLATTKGLLEVDLAYTSVSPRSSPQRPLVHRKGGHLEIRLPGDGKTEPWSLHSIDGSTLGAGFVNSDRVDISCPTGATWIRIGQRTFRIPPY